MSEKSTDNKEEVSPDCNEEKKKDQASETATNESSSGNSWIPGLAASWVNTAKEKTISTFEMMKKDIHEFSDTLQQGANTLAGATVKQAHHIQNLIAPVPDNVANEEQNKSEEEGTSKQSSEETNKTCKDKSGLFNFGWMKQVVDTVHKYATEDTVEDECTEELFIGTGGRKTILDQFTLLQMQNDPRTFTQAPQQNVDLYKEWLNDFKISEYNGEINLLLSNNPRLREIYAELVPSQVDNNAFWNRYFFKVHLKELDKQIAMVENPSLTKTDSTPKEGYSPAPSNGKDDWSMCSSGPAPEELDEENGREQETSTPRPQKDDEVDDWEECLDEANELICGPSFQYNLLKKIFIS
uniref:BSD domain-containing protein n=2 Tax=Meloidogyne TaxID=189290 RepID=A0A914LZX1_MELIC